MVGGAEPWFFLVVFEENDGKGVAAALLRKLPWALNMEIWFCTEV